MRPGRPSGGWFTKALLMRLLIADGQQRQPSAYPSLEMRERMRAVMPLAAAAESSGVVPKGPA